VWNFTSTPQYLITYGHDFTFHLSLTEGRKTVKKIFTGISSLEHNTIGHQITKSHTKCLTFTGHLLDSELVS
jgi:hypothetical protein